MLTVKAFAKVNLVLEVLGRRADGYHEIASIMQTISLSDVLTLEPADRIGLKFSPPGLPDHANITLKSAQRLAEVTGFGGGVVIGLEKHIPMGAGLGGGSSDAAAVLYGLNNLWQLGLTGEQLAEIGAGLGSDVPFFIYGGACLVEGRGERITPLADLEKMWFVLLRPDLPVQPAKTAALYRLLTPGHYTSGEISAGVRKLFESGGKRQQWPLYNVFEKVAPDAFPGLGKHMKELLRAGAPEVYLAGSGPVLFTMLYDEKQASDILANLLAGGLEAYLVTSVGGRRLAAEDGKPAGIKTKWLKEGLLLLGMIALSTAIAFLLFRFRDIFSLSLQSYGWLAYLVVFCVSLLSSSTIFIPTPGTAIVLAAATIWNPVLVGLIAGTGDAIGELTAYWVGYAGEKIMIDEHVPAYQKAVSWMDRYGAWAVFGVALVPVVLFDLVGLAAGVLKIKWWKFLLATWCGKVPRAIVLCSIGHQLLQFFQSWHF